MANNITNIYFSNTFGDLVRTANNLVNAWQYLGFYDWDKPSGKFSISSVGTGFQANTDAVFSRETRVEGVGSSLYVQNNAEVGKTLTLSDRANNVTLYSNGASIFSGGHENYVTYLNSIGYENTNEKYGIITTAKSLFANNVDILQIANTDLIQSNDAIVFYNTSGNTAQFSANVTVGNLVSNNFIYAANNISTNRHLYIALNSYTIGTTITNYLQSNNTTNTSFLSVTNNSFTNYLQANTNLQTSVAVANTRVVTATVQANTIVHSNTVSANTVVTTPTLHGSSNTFTDYAQANTRVVTGIVQANTRVVSNTVSANSLVTTPTLHGSSNTFTDYAQANTRVVTGIVQANTNLYTATISANSSVVTPTVQASSNVYTNYLKSNNFVVTDVLESQSRTITNVSQANTRVVTGIVQANTNVISNTVSANTVVTTPTLHGSSNSFTDYAQANTRVVTGIVQANTNVISNDILANTRVVTATVQANTIVHSNTVSANTVVTTPTLHGSSNTFTNYAQANTRVVTGIVQANTIVHSNTVSANTVVTTPTLHGSSNTFTNYAQANTSVVTGIIQANTRVVTGIVQANTNVISNDILANTRVVTGVVQANTNVISNDILANNRVVTATIQANTIVYSNTVSANTVVTTPTLHGSSNVYTNYAQANASVVTGIVQANTRVVSSAITANSLVTTPTLHGSSNTFTNYAQANTSVVTGIVQANTRIISSTISANSLVTTPTLHGSSNVYTNYAQANTRVVTSTIQANTNVISNDILANTRVVTGVVQANTNVISNDILANTRVVTGIVQANTNVISNDILANTRVVTGIVQANNILVTDYTQANSSVNTRTVSATNQIFAKNIVANTDITSLGYSNSVNIIASNNVDANSVGRTFGNYYSVHNVFSNNISSQYSTVLEKLTVVGDLVIAGSTSQDSTSLTISSNTPLWYPERINLPSGLIVNRTYNGTSYFSNTYDAQIFWTEQTKRWRVVQDVNTNYSCNILLETDATTTNTANKVVIRDTSGNFSAGTITASLTGNATSASKVNSVLTRGTYLTGSNFDGSAATTWAVDATTTNTANKVVARDGSGNFSAGTISAALSGNATTATTLQTARNINNISFNGSSNILIPNLYGTNGTTTLTTVGVTSGTNYATITNAANGSPVTISSNGTYDINVGLSLTTKGTGDITLDTGTGLGNINLKPGTSHVRIWDDNSTNYWEFVTSDITSNYTVTLPVGNVVLTAGTMVPTSRTLTVSNGTGITGGSSYDLSSNRSWTIGLTGQALNLHNMTTTGLFARTSGGTITARSISVSGIGLSVSNADGSSGNPTVTSNATNTNTAGTIVARDSNGDFAGRYISATYLNSSDNSVTSGVTGLMSKTSDNYLRTASAAAVASFISGQTMNINGTATGIGGAGVVNASTGTFSSTLSVTGSITSSTRISAAGNQAYASLGTPTGALGGLEITGPNSTSAAFMGFHRQGAYATYFGLGTNNRLQVGGWSAGTTVYNIPYSTLGITFDSTDQAGTPARVWGSSNDGTTWYEYSPANFSVNYATSAGSATSASNATTVTNGVYTTGSYADPSWITSLSKSKVGLSVVENTALSTWAGTTNLTTLGNATAQSLIVSGDLTINGTTTTVDSSVVVLNDPILTLGGKTATAETAKDRGIEFKWGGFSLTMTNFIGNGTTTVTGTVASTSGYVVGDIITISGASGTEQSKLNGTWKIASVPNATTFTFVVSTNVTLGTYTTGIGSTVKSYNGFFGLDQNTGKFTFIPKSNNTGEIFSGTLGLMDSGILGTGTANSTTYLRGDSTWQTLNKTTIGLGNVENTALSTWTGTSTISTVGTITSGTWSGSFGAVSGANLTTLNASNLASGTVPDARISGSYTGMTNLTGSGTVDFSKFLGNASDTVSAPSFSWTGDTNTGIYQPAADNIAFTAGGVERLRANSAGIYASVAYYGAGTGLTGTASGLTAGAVTNGVYTTGNQTIAGTKTFSSTIAGSINGNAATVTNGVYTTGDQTIAGTKTFSSTIAGSINGNAATASKVNNVLTRGSYLTGNNFDGSAATTWAVDATTTNTASKIVARDTSGNFSAGTISASLNGNATSASKVNNVLTRGSYLTGNNFDGSAATTWAVDATTTNTASKIVARDASGQIAASSAIIGTSDINSSGSIELNRLGTGDRTTLIDFHSAGTAGQYDFNARIIRDPGYNGNFWMANIGTGATGMSAGSATAILYSNGTFVLNGTLQVGVGGSSSITMSDSDEGNRHIHCNQNNIGFLKQDSNWGAYCDDSGNWTAVGNVTAYSDRNLKKNILTIENALDKVKKLRGVSFTKIDTEEKGIGVIAQEIQEVLPEVVVEGSDGTLSVAYGNIVGVLIEAIKEQQKQIDELKAKIGN